LLEAGDLVPGGHAEEAELALDLPLDQAGQDLPVLLGAAHHVLGHPADLGRLRLALLGEQARHPLGLDPGQLAEARQRLQVLLSPARHLTTSNARPALGFWQRPPKPVNEVGLATSPCGRTGQSEAGRGGGVATKAEVERQLGLLMSRLDGNEANVRSAIPTRKVLRCHVPDLGADWYSVVDNGHVSQPSETPPNGRADITLRVGSDDLVDLVEGRTSFLSALTSGKVRVDASIVDLLRLRSLL
jgi:hypothetical protein